MDTLRVHWICAVSVVALFTGCASTRFAPRTEKEVMAARVLRQAHSLGASAETRAGLYLQAAAMTSPLLGPGEVPSPAREIYNSASAELTSLLRTADDGRLWNRPLALTAGEKTYRLRFQPGQADGVWEPAYFTAFKPAREVPEKTIKRHDRRPGVGGALVGVRKKSPREPFAPLAGIAGPVTATLDFHGQEATLALYDPTRQSQATVGGEARPLAGDFSAPLAYYPAVNELVEGLMGALRVSHYMHTTGIYFLEPYDPKRIPLIFVHGLISTPQMWRNVINEIEADPELRGRFQCWVFGYPTGNPASYSALRFREELEKVRKIYGWPRGFVLVGHSMGGLLSQMQVATVDRAAWERGSQPIGKKLMARLPKDSLVYRSIVFDANPNVRRVVFICTPHRGSEMAISNIGGIAMRLIALPVTLTATLTKTLGSSLTLFTGSSGRMPNSITSLSPRNPTLKVLDQAPIRVPYHTILGDRGRNDSPNSSDGVVPYWSSHMDMAQSEKIVPGPHGSCELPQTIDELRRIVRLHLKTADR